MEKMEQGGGMQGLLSVRDAAAYLGVARQTLFNWINKGRITYTKLGSRVLFRCQDLEKFINSRTIPAKNDLGGKN
jgi:excisionase family DNA binding protein